MNKIDRTELEKELKITQLKDKIYLAQVNCLSPSELIKNLWKEPLLPYSYKYPYVGRLYEIGLDKSAIPEALKLIQHLISISENLPYDSKRRCDSFLKYLLELCPDETTNPLLIEFLTHKREYRRQIAFDLLRKKNLSKKDVNLLVTHFKKSKDVSFLEIIARHPNSIKSLKIAEFLLNNLDSTYWKCRVIEALLNNKISNGLTLARKHHLEFIYAVGRLNRGDLLSEIKPFIKNFLSDYDNLGLVIWALGRIQAKKEIDKIEKLLQRQSSKKLSFDNIEPGEYAIRFVKHMYGFKKERRWES